jgi:quercetin dioxygenase-like cupin family protein
MTEIITTAELVAGDVVFAVAGKPRPFPYVVTNVITNEKYGVTRVDFEHGGIIPPCDSKTLVTVMQRS